MVWFVNFEYFDSRSFNFRSINLRSIHLGAST